MFVPRSLKVANRKKKILRKSVHSDKERPNSQNNCDGPNTRAKYSTGQFNLTHDETSEAVNGEHKIQEINIRHDLNKNFPEEETATKPESMNNREGGESHIECTEELKTVECKPLIKSYCKQQRLPVPGEPSCIVCGRYGEYICDQTDADVCSLECKARNLARKKQSIEEAISLQPSHEEPGPSEGYPDEYAEESGVLEDRLDEYVDQDLLDVGPSRCTAGYSYREHSTLTNLTNEQVYELRNEVSIFVEGLNVPKPITDFSQLGLPKTMAFNLKTSGYKIPTPVQMQVIPAALLKHDLMVCAQTSSGKTASFLIPATLHIYNEVHEKEQKRFPVVIILTPTRELAMQIEKQAKEIMKGLQNMKTCLLVGGLPLPPQIHRLKQGIQLVIATPGRLLEIMNKKGICLDHIELLVIDEVDSMLQMGFQDQVISIMKELPDDHQTTLFSATIPKSIEMFASSLLHNATYISIGTPSTPSSSVKHTVLWVEDPSKKKKLFTILQDPKHYKPPLVVFVDSKLGCEMLAQTIRKICGYKVATLHGDKSQVERSQTLKLFLETSLPIMVCTSVLGRGIDLVGVKLVINFDMPNTVEEYIHQIGRTGRLGGQGTAITFINNASKHLFFEFVMVLQPLSVQLPAQLCNSPHFHLQKEKHERHKSKKTIFSRKRKQQREGVKDLLHKRKWKVKF
ncbi:probable ATP-dependent RNA helicase DDX59 [Anneissia japonica]|uniref:probable ATP-dependent RNA helicase DDX59 n=1 Tax=Anneissia japonica TaxID=1529436 RepID=UPI0014258694|nr:probable ATP-dependent RNA helicase DDX59 [Anneissia japonica]XP_033125172.1 probable ATP-dependent RNA helicase DDX59 [Anneissia japonica]